ncbi:hypothetical protein X566_01480 [Afipia sp. P52-10]|uniref:capsid cement protein n=1 Tax=Afipia sp. P52-10 TaxID=1429916 RepID=UPI0003DF1DEF|nr:capsid cement protein [Afipia sp. P52-10]ETR79288.1 hypothetical protein X566_01480 [Afipia sp. P52-10]
MSIPTLIRSYPCPADVAPHRIVKFSDVSASSSVAQATAATEPLWGVSDAMGGSAGGMVDVILAGLGEVQLGGTVTAGAPLTSDADGKAVALVGSAGATRRLVGFAEQPGVAGDIIRISVERSVLQLPA